MRWSEAYSTARDAAVPPPWWTPFGAAAGQVLAAAIVAATPSPAFTSAAMDGYAVAGRGPWRVLGRALAGHPAPVSRLGGGDVVEIATGARLPDGADAVVP
ncbi:hypothetical protein [Dactylosporangium sp. NPDC049140]|uniref:hypothetical protein n=1 Tax=Dactylosporangium sp. NPDC049140 TaxID=3155647 RepID=UPI0033F07D86